MSGRRNAELDHVLWGEELAKCGWDGLSLLLLLLIVYIDVDCVECRGGGRKGSGSRQKRRARGELGASISY
jgi:hypothetical protein